MPTPAITKKDADYNALMKAAQRGDKAAYRRLLRSITPLLRTIVARQCRFLKPHDIEDLVQDILLSLHAVRATYDPRRPFLPWLLAIARHRLADGARRQARRANELAVANLPESFADDSAIRLVPNYRDPEALRNAIQALPPGQRAAIEMVKLQELSLKQAAALSGSSIGALKVAVHRAMCSLRKVLRTEG